MWVIMWMRMGGLRAQIRNKDLTITRQEFSPLWHNFWISRYSFFVSLFISSASAFRLTTLLLESAQEVTTEPETLRHNSRVESVV
jgi:hypothetical protein